MVNQITENGRELLLRGKYFMLMLISTKDYSVLKLSVYLNWRIKSLRFLKHRKLLNPLSCGGSVSLIRLENSFTSFAKCGRSLISLDKHMWSWVKDLCLTVRLILCSGAASPSHGRVSGKARAVSVTRNTNAVLGTLNCFRGTNVLSTIQLFNLLFGRTVLCLCHFVDAKAGVDDKCVPGICRVVYGGILQARLYLGEFGQVKTSMSGSITVK